MSLLNIDGKPDPALMTLKKTMCVAVPELMAQLGSTAFGTRDSRVYSSSAVWVSLTCVVAGSLASLSARYCHP